MTVIEIHLFCTTAMEGKQIWLKILYRLKIWLKIFFFLLKILLFTTAMEGNKLKKLLGSWYNKFY